MYTYTLLEMNRIFGLDVQTVVDTVITLIAVLALFVLLSYLLFNPARELLRKRKERVQNDMEQAASSREEAQRYKDEYDEKLKNVDQETQQILSDARKKALAQETVIVDDAKEEAKKIIARANREVELEKSKVKDEMKQEMIEIAAAMAAKFTKAGLTKDEQHEIIEQTLREMGDETWQN